MIARSTSTPSPACEAAAPRAGLHPYLKLAIGILLILFFIFGIGSLSKFLPGAKRMAQVIDERNLRATAIYYTDFEEPAEASESIGHSLDYPPGVR
jgi:hypothetical protein